jgi:hypothetical protein
MGARLRRKNNVKFDGRLLMHESYTAKITADIWRAENERAFEFPDDRFECWYKSDWPLVGHTYARIGVTFRKRFVETFESRFQLLQ